MSHLSKLFALSVGFSAITTNMINASENVSESMVFGIEPQEITLAECYEETVSIGNIHQMIAKRNTRDKKLVRSTADKHCHL